MNEKKRKLLTFLALSLLMLVPAYATISMLLQMQVTTVVHESPIYFEQGMDATSNYVNVTLNTNKTQASISVYVFPDVEVNYTDVLRIISRDDNIRFKVSLVGTPSLPDIRILKIYIIGVDMEYILVASYEYGEWTWTQMEDYYLLSAGQEVTLFISVTGYDNITVGSTASFSLQLYAEKLTG